MKVICEENIFKGPLATGHMYLLSISQHLTEMMTCDFLVIDLLSTRLIMLIRYIEWISIKHLLLIKGKRFGGISKHLKIVIVRLPNLINSYTLDNRKFLFRKLNSEVALIKLLILFGIVMYTRQNGPEPGTRHSKRLS